MRVSIFLSVLLASLYLALFSLHGNSAVEATLVIQERYFYESGFQKQKKNHAAITLALSYHHQFNDDNTFNSQIMYRFDTEDDDANLFDVQQFSWNHVDNGWELRAGSRIEYWGVTEAQHLVNIINQTDFAAHPDGEQKLGQPMINVLLDRDWGTLEFFLMPYFRERTWVGESGRFRSPIPIDKNSRYQSSAQQWHTDTAVRWSHTIENLDIAFSFFNGTSRDPLFDLAFKTALPADFNDVYLIAYYQQIDQAGLELQYIIDSWALKLEAINRNGSREDFAASTIGFEYTASGVFNSDSDVGYLVEYLYDSRADKAPTGVFEQDLLLAFRWGFNDLALSEILVGVVVDIQSNEQLLFLEASRRFSGGWKLSLESRLFENVPPVDNSLTTVLRTISEHQENTKNSFFSEDSFLQIKLNYFF